MRIWTVHPKHLDRQGLLAVWREGLLAQKVLMGLTKGYRHHPQLLRFKEHPSPIAAIASYLLEINKEAKRRGYSFDEGKIAPVRTKVAIPETCGQLMFEWEHLKRKIELRSGATERTPGVEEKPSVHPIFNIVDGPIEPWEKTLLKDEK